MNLVLSFRAGDLVERLPGLEEAARKQALLRAVEPGLGSAIGLGSRTLSDTDICLERSISREFGDWSDMTYMCVLGCDYANVVQSIHRHDIVRGEPIRNVKSITLTKKIGTYLNL